MSCLNLIKNEDNIMNLNEKINKLEDSGDSPSGKKISRRNFFRRIGFVSLIPLAGIWFSTSKQSLLREKKIEKVIIPANIPDGISFYDSVIISKNNKGIKVLSSKCTHLGCKINETNGNTLVCPCHGSQYAFDGSVIKGPAGKALKSLPFQINAQTGEITVNVQV